MSCLFNSIDFFLHLGSYTIRQQICDYLHDNKPIIDGIDTHTVLSFESSDYNTYIKNMRLMSTWGGAIEIQAACNIWNMKIIVKNYRDNSKQNIEFLPLNGNIQKTICVYWTGGHYEPLSSF